MAGNGSKALSKSRKGQHLNEVSKAVEMEKPLLAAFKRAARKVQDEIGKNGKLFSLEWTSHVPISTAIEGSNVNALEDPDAEINAGLVEEGLVPEYFKYSIQEHIAKFPHKPPKAVPDAGVLWMVLSDGRRIPFACAEAKRQGEGGYVQGVVKEKSLENDNSGFALGQSGNAVERAYKNFLLWCDCVRSIPATGYFLFCEGEGFKMQSTNQKFSAICGYDRLNRFNIVDKNNMKRASVFVRCAKDDYWTHEQMEGILFLGMKKLAEKYIEFYGLEEGGDAISAA